MGNHQTAAKPNEKSAIPELLATLALEDSIVAIGTQPDIAPAIRDRGAHYLLAVKDKQLKLTEPISDFINAFAGAEIRGMSSAFPSAILGGLHSAVFP